MSASILISAPPRSIRAGAKATRGSVSRRGGDRKLSLICRAANKDDKNKGGGGGSGGSDDDDDGKNHTVLVCGGKTCRRQGALNTMSFFRQVVPDDVVVKRVGCMNRCGKGPNCELLPNELFVGHVNTAAHVVREKRGTRRATEPNPAPQRKKAKSRISSCRSRKLS